MSVKTKRVILALFLSVFLIYPTAILACTYSSILAFGDSLSDNGYYQGYPGGTSGNINPSDIYGFQRYSNGPVWVEYLAQRYGLSLLDMAYGGATSGYNNPAAYQATGDIKYKTETGLQWQVAKYAGTFGTISSDALITVWAGGNDMLNYASNPALYNPIVAAANVAKAIDNLIDNGGRNFIVPNLSWNAITDPTLLAGAMAWMAPFNYYLVLDLQGPDAIPGVNIYEIDLTQLNYVGLNYNGTVTNPNGQTGPFANYDSVHPSTEGHLQIAGYVASEVPVPEPATMLLLGSGLIGLAGYGRKKFFKK
jgi:phospholipase/lecithinase/hemolysin